MFAKFSSLIFGVMMACMTKLTGTLFSKLDPESRTGFYPFSVGIWQTS